MEKEKVGFFWSRRETIRCEKGVDGIEATLHGILHVTWRATRTPEPDKHYWLITQGEEQCRLVTHVLDMLGL